MRGLRRTARTGSLASARRARRDPGRRSRDRRAPGYGAEASRVRVTVAVGASYAQIKRISGVPSDAARRPRVATGPGECDVVLLAVVAATRHHRRAARPRWSDVERRARRRARRGSHRRSSRRRFPTTGVRSGTRRREHGARARHCTTSSMATLSPSSRSRTVALSNASVACGAGATMAEKATRIVSGPPSHCAKGRRRFARSAKRRGTIWRRSPRRPVRQIIRSRGGRRRIRDEYDRWRDCDSASPPRRWSCARPRLRSPRGCARRSTPAERLALPNAARRCEWRRSALRAT